MKELSVTNKIINCLINDMVVKKGQQDHFCFYPFGQPESSTQNQESCWYCTEICGKDDKLYLFFNFELPDINILD